MGRQIAKETDKAQQMGYPMPEGPDIFDEESSKVCAHDETDGQIGQETHSIVDNHGPPSDISALFKKPVHVHKDGAHFEEKESGRWIHHERSLRKLDNGAG